MKKSPEEEEEGASEKVSGKKEQVKKSPVEEEEGASEEASEKKEQVKKSLRRRPSLPRVD